MKNIAIATGIGAGVMALLVGLVFVYYAWQYWRHS